MFLGRAELFLWSACQGLPLQSIVSPQYNWCRYTNYFKQEVRDAAVCAHRLCYIAGMVNESSCKKVRCNISMQHFL